MDIVIELQLTAPVIIVSFLFGLKRLFLAVSREK